MSKQKTLILDKERINKKLQRMAYQIWEEYSEETAITLIGIDGSGAIVAKSLAKRLVKISPLEVEYINIKLNKRKPLKGEIVLEDELNDKAVVLVDDVANSGKTLLYALRPILDYEPKKVMIAVLLDRRHKSFPITPDIVGHSIATTLQEHIEVETKGESITAAYLQ